MTRRAAEIAQDPLWYKDAVIYELRVRSFQDGDDDGIGDFKGLVKRLDYLQDLGVTALWLLPFCPSPLLDDGYDISDYRDVHPELGTLADFKVFLREAHRRGLRVITELVINHTSDQHPWFQRARNAPPGSRWRDYYVWSDTTERYREARIIFQDFERSNWTWDPVARAYYWHRFYAHQPDLNFDSPDVRRSLIRCLHFWLNLGVDGLRLDAIPYLFEREGTNCENLSETHAFLRELRASVDERYEGRMLLAEANQWPEDAVAYFGKGDECHMAFHFPVMPRLFMSLQMEDRHPIVDILSQTPAIPDTCQWAIFLRNHDELTLEMVTDEERDYMYRFYARDKRARVNLGIRRRLAPLLGNDRRRIELLNALLFSMPGTPVVYYGDEIGMGDNFYLGDRNGVRTPMQWSPDRNAGFSGANPQQLYLPVIVDPEYHYESVNVETQQHNPYSLLHWTKRLIALARRHPAMGRGQIEFLHPDNRKVLAFLRSWQDERILVVANLSRFVEYVELDLRAFAGQVPVELFGGRPFPRIGELPYLLTIGPHGFFWFRIEEDHPEVSRRWTPTAEDLPAVEVDDTWNAVVVGRAREALEAALPSVLGNTRWFGGKGRAITRTRLHDAVPVRSRGALLGYLALFAIDQEGSQDLYTLPLAFAEGEPAERLRHRRGIGIAELTGVEGAADGRGLLYDASADGEFGAALLDAIRRGRALQGQQGTILPSRTRLLREVFEGDETPPPPRLRDAEQTNTSLVFGTQAILKLFRRPVEGTNPDLEIGRHLSETASFTHTPATLGALEYGQGRESRRTLAILHAFVENEGDAWHLTLDRVQKYLEHALAADAPPAELSHNAASGNPTEMELGVYAELARMLGERTADLHLALAADREHPDFAPEPFGKLYQRSRYQSMRNTAARSLDQLRRSAASLEGEVAEQARRVLASEQRIDEVFRWLVGPRIEGVRTRCHGDYHLGQVLYTGRDFVILDFEGEPARPIAERRLKRSPLVDVAGMLRSFDYASWYWLVRAGVEGIVRPEDVPRLEPWARLWSREVARIFLDGYRPRVQEAGLVPRGEAESRRLLHVLMLEKSLYELGYELGHRPEWVGVPLRGVLDLLEGEAR